MPDVSQIEERLRIRLRELNERLEKTESELDQPMNADAEDRATERESDEVLEGLGNAGLAEIRMIEAALDRIRDGTFGECVACGEPISDERLDAVPYPARCRNCAQVGFRG